MRNYLAAEWYKVIRRKYLYLTLLVVLALGYFFCLGVRGRKEGGEINFWASLLVLLAALLRLGELLEQ